MKNRIKELCKKKGVSMAQAEQDLGVAKGYLSKMEGSNPNASKLQKMAEYFNVTPGYILTGETTEAEYYMNPDARELAQFLFEHPDYKVLFDASRKVKKEDLMIVKEIIDRFNGG